MADEEPSAEEMNEKEMAKWLILSLAVLFVLVLIPILSKIKRTRGKKIIYHLIYVVTAVVLLLLVPEEFQDMCFSVSAVQSSPAPLLVLSFVEN